MTDTKTGRKTVKPEEWSIELMEIQLKILKTLKSIMKALEKVNAPTADR